MKKLIRHILREETETPIAEPFYIKLYEKMDKMGAIPFTTKVLPDASCCLGKDKRIYFDIIINH